MNRLMVFDLDGVLFESRDMHYEALNRALVDNEHSPIFYEDHLARFNGRPTRMKLAMLNITGEQAERVERDKQAHTLGWIYKNVKRDEVLEALFRDLRNDGWKVAVATNTLHITAVAALKLLGLWELCDLVACGDRHAPKPAPDMHYWLMRELDAGPLTTWVIEDSPVGLAAARASGAHVEEVAGPKVVPDVVLAIMEKSQ